MQIIRRQATALPTISPSSRPTWLVALAMLIATQLGGCKHTAQSNVPPPLPGGLASVALHDHNAFSMPSSNMPLPRRVDFSVGNSFFRNPWVSAPASTSARDGLGPLFNTNACQNCHIKDGRGHAPEHGDNDITSALLRISVRQSHQGNPFTETAHPILGDQIQDRALPGLQPEAKIAVHYTSHTVTLRGGEKVELRKPLISLHDVAYGASTESLLLSLRIAPPMIGLGLLAAIPASDIVAGADPDDQNGDGISGRVNRVPDKQTGELVLGRFGWKAGQPTLRQQNAAAFFGDMGITSSLFPDENCTQPQHRLCAQHDHDPDIEISDALLDQVTFYTANLAVPTRRPVPGNNVARGERHFHDLGCAGCHRPSWKTGDVPDSPWLSGQTIYPYTDLLLHDMGDGLADNRSEFAASGREWRTPPLWGVGLAQTVSAEAGFLHDGRARTVTEAILWHGGEAAQSRAQFMNMNAQGRAALLAFLLSL